MHDRCQPIGARRFTDAAPPPAVLILPGPVRPLIQCSECVFAPIMHRGGMLRRPAEHPPLHQGFGGQGSCPGAITGSLSLYPSVLFPARCRQVRATRPPPTIAAWRLSCSCLLLMELPGVLLSRLCVSGVRCRRALQLQSWPPR